MSIALKLCMPLIVKLTTGQTLYHQQLPSVFQDCVCLSVPGLHRACWLA